MTDDVKARDVVWVKALGQELRAARLNRGWSGRQLVEALPTKIDLRTLGAWELGYRQFAIGRLVEICDTLNVTVADFMARVESNAKQRAHTDTQEHQEEREDAIDRRREEGITIGMIDTILAVARIVARRNLTSASVKEALDDLRDDAAVALLVPNVLAKRR